MKKLSALMLALFIVASSAFVFTPKPALAGCQCDLNPAANTKDSNVTNDGMYVEINDGGVTCQQKYGVAVNPPTVVECDPYNASIDPGFTVPTFSTIMGSLIRLIFFIAGLMALVFMLLGGLAWVQSAGDEKKVGEAQKKITASVIGLVVMIAVLSLVIFLEQVVFGGKFCLGISCPMNINFLQLIR